MVFKLKQRLSGLSPRLRSIIAQVIACTSPNLLLLDLAMAVGFVTIAVPELLDAKEGVSLNETQASWFGSIAFLTQPIGALISGPMVDYFGRKKANFFVNIPHIIAWTLMYFAWDVPSLFAANILLGIGTGVMEAPVNSYVGEISDPSLRGTLITMVQVSFTLGTVLMYFLGTVVHWRTAALISLAAPLIAMVLVLMLPETPVWLLSQGRDEEALKSLCYLRGWTSPEYVKEEFDQLVQYTKELKRCVLCIKTNQEPADCQHDKMNVIKRNILQFKYLMFGRETMGPLVLIMLYFVFYNMSGIWPVSINMENVCLAYGMAEDGKSIVFYVGVIILVVTILFMAIVTYTGKRKFALISMLGTAICGTMLSVYAKQNLASNVFSYDAATFPKNSETYPLIVFYIMTAFTGVSLPWIVLGEVFPFRSRAIAQGIAAAGNYIIMFLASKTLIDLEKTIHLWGAFALYAGFAYVGFIYLYFFLPETEGKSLEEIETYYSGKIRIFSNDPCFRFMKRSNGNSSYDIKTRY